MIFFGHIGITLLVVYLVASAMKKSVDYRLVVIGAMLPDIIDKPLGEYLLSGIFHNGRIFAHTLAFVVVLSIIAIIVAWRYRYWGIGILAFGAFVHQLLDQMWNTPQTWFWPALGWAFPKNPLDNYALYILNNLLTEPSAYVPEIVGFIIVAAFVMRFRLYQRDNAWRFIRTGEMAVKPELVVTQPELIIK